MRTYLLEIARELSSRAVLLPALLLLAACGGGGGGGGDGGPAPVVYGGNTSVAVVTTANASKLTANVIGSEDTAATILGVSIESGDARQTRGSGLAHLARHLNGNIRDTVLRANTAQRLAPAVQIDQTEPCDGGNGSVRTSGTLSDVNFTGTLAVSFNNCLIDGDTWNGPATLRVDAFSFAFPQGIPSDSTLSFVRLTIRGPGVSDDWGGSLRLQSNFETHTETFTANLVVLNNITGEMAKTENLVFVDVYDNIFSPSSFTETINGRVFHSVHGWVDITTPTPLVFGTLNQLFPDSGQMLLTGAANSTIRVTALSSTMVELQLDTNGDNTVDNTARLKWTELTGPVGTDLGDTDLDGMHNSWETVNGLNPADPLDAVADNDVDTFTNLSEYMAGTDPNDASSHP